MGGYIMKYRFFFVFLVSLGAVFSFVAQLAAANLTVMPTSLRIAPPKAADIVTIRNEGRRPVKMQIRLFRWEQKGGKDVYHPAQGVVATPPFITIKGGADGNIRVIRTAKTAVSGTESYRLIIDELPSSRVRARVKGQAASVEVVTRQILPVFFTSTPEPGGNHGGGAAAPRLSFRAQAARGGYEITAINGSRAVLRIGAVSLWAGGTEIGRSGRSVGNVLPKSEVKFFVPAKGGGKPQEIRVLEGKGIEGTYPLQ
ncbi:hypothetical protein DPQ22_04480 [Candidatus Tokpelaia sp.]|nr:hypothetical protein DPQ22_04480 [Candidatus Tokpelaia sp.]